MALSEAKVSVIGPVLAFVYPSQALSSRLINNEPIAKSDLISIFGVSMGVLLIVIHGVGVI